MSEKWIELSILCVPWDDLPVLSQSGIMVFNNKLNRLNSHVIYATNGTIIVGDQQLTLVYRQFVEYSVDGHNIPRTSADLESLLLCNLAFLIGHKILMLIWRRNIAYSGASSNRSWVQYVLSQPCSAPQPHSLDPYWAIHERQRKTQGFVGFPEDCDPQKDTGDLLVLF